MTDGTSSALFAAGAFVASVALQRAFLRYARRAMLDRPNERSSHSIPTPRGGGAVVVGVYLVVVAVGQMFTSQPALPMTGALLGILMVALVGWLDDRKSLGVLTRLAVHTAAGVLMIPAALRIAPPSMPSVVAAVIVVVATVAAVNVLNFMDGIDGLITSQVSIFAGHLLVISTTDFSRQSAAVLLGATAGFLVWNWPPARIFLGDVGSGAMGAICVFGGLQASVQNFTPQWFIFAPLTPLFMDAAVTLARRAIRGANLATAHREHLYQRLANGGWGHQRVTGLYALASLTAMAMARIAGSQPSAGVAYLALLTFIGWVLDRRYPLILPHLRSPNSGPERQ